MFGWEEVDLEDVDGGGWLHGCVIQVRQYVDLIGRLHMHVSSILTADQACRHENPAGFPAQRIVRVQQIKWVNRINSLNSTIKH